MGILGYAGHNFGPTPGGGGGDSPAVTNVRAGVAYDFGASVGTLALPDVSNVRQGVKFGAATVEFTGTLKAADVAGGFGLGPDPFGPGASRSVRIVQLLEAVANRLRLYLQTQSRVVQWAAEVADRPPVEGADVAAVGLGGWEPRPDSGAGRWGWLSRIEVLVGVWTRDLRDQTGDHSAWLRAHDRRVWRAVDAIDGKMLYASYGPAGGPTGALLTTAPCQLRPDRIIIKRVERHEAGVSVLRFGVPVVLPLNPARTA